jgi:hypothetical protein
MTGFGDGRLSVRIKRTKGNEGGAREVSKSKVKVLLKLEGLLPASCLKSQKGEMHH